MDDPLVSVAIVAYNQKLYIARTIEGALQQRTGFGVEIIVGDDCSADGTREIALEYQRRHPDRVRVLASNCNVGSHRNYLNVLAAARGKYMASCDGDDYWTHPAKLQRQVEFLEANPEYSLCCHDVEVICDGVPSNGDKYVKFTGDTFTFDDAVRGHFIPTLSTVYRRELLATIPPWFTECLSGDLVVDLLLLDQGPGRYIHENMGIKRDNAGGITRAPGRRAKVVENFLDMYKRIDVHTEGRHTEILRWKIARLSLMRAGEHLRARRLAPFLLATLESLRCDRTAVRDAARRRLTLRPSMRRPAE